MAVTTVVSFCVLSYSCISQLMCRLYSLWSHQSILPVWSSSSALIIQTRCWLHSKTRQLWVLPAAQTSPSLPFCWTVLLGDRFLNWLSLNFEVILNHSFLCSWHQSSSWWTVLPVVAVPSVASLLFVWIHNFLYGSGCFGARVLDLTDPWRCCPIHTLDSVCRYAPSNLRRIPSRRHCFPSLQPPVNRRNKKEPSVWVLIVRALRAPALRL